MIVANIRPYGIPIRRDIRDVILDLYDSLRDFRIEEVISSAFIEFEDVRRRLLDFQNVQVVIVRYKREIWKFSVPDRYVHLLYRFYVALLDQQYLAPYVRLPPRFPVSCRECFFKLCRQLPETFNLGCRLEEIHRAH